MLSKRGAGRRAAITTTFELKFIFIFISKVSSQSVMRTRALEPVVNVLVEESGETRGRAEPASPCLGKLRRSRTFC